MTVSDFLDLLDPYPLDFEMKMNDGRYIDQVHFDDRTNTLMLRADNQERYTNIRNIKRYINDQKVNLFTLVTVDEHGLSKNNSNLVMDVESSDNAVYIIPKSAYDVKSALQDFIDYMQLPGYDDWCFVRDVFALGFTLEDFDLVGGHWKEWTAFASQRHKIYPM